MRARGGKGRAAVALQSRQAAGPMIRIDDLIAKTSAYLPRKADKGRIGKAYVYSAQLHRDRFLPGGSPLLQHTLEVAYILAELRLDPVCIVTGLLHDVLEEGLADAAEIRKVAGDEVAGLLEELANLSRASYRGSEESRAEHMRQMILSTTRDLRVILILLAGRLQAMRNLEQFEPEDRGAIARETLHIYAPIAHRLGIHFFLAEMEDTAFQAIEPEAARELQAAVESQVAARRERIERINEELRGLLEDNGIQGEVIGRTKHLYSIHRKLKKTQGTVDQIYDLLATRIIVETQAECYSVLGMIHGAYTPIPGRFKDYIAIPKGNGYRTLHSTVFAPSGDIVEVQIRTVEMHRQAELGIAAHFNYKGGASADERELANLSWFRRLLDTMEAGQDPKESMDLLERDLNPDEIFVFTPVGEVIKLPNRASAIDFAYAIHSDVGNRCMGAKMDGRMIPIRSPLKNGTVVEIITSNRVSPRKDWLKHAVTSKALARIRAHLRQKERSELADQGRERCVREAKRFGQKIEELLKADGFREWMRRNNLSSADDIYAAEAAGRVSLREALEKLYPDSDTSPEATGAPAPPNPETKGHPDLAPNLVQVSGVSGLMVRFARCCAPKIGDPLRGIVTRGQGISVHHRDCGNLGRVRNQPERLLEVEWVQERRARQPVRLVVSAESSTQGLIQVAKLLEEEGTPIESGTITSEGERYTQRLTVMVSDTKQVKRILHRLNAMAGIRAVRELESA